MTSSKKPRLPLELFFAYLLPLPALMVGLFWTGLFTAISFSLVWVDGLRMLRVDASGNQSLEPLGVLLIVASLMLGMLPAIARLTSAAEEWDNQDRQPPFANRRRWREEREMLATSAPMEGRWIAHLLGLLVGLGVIYFVMLERNLENLHQPSLAWACLQFAALFLLLARGILKNRAAKKKRNELLAKADVVDLLDLSPQYRAARHAGRSCLSWLAGASLSALFFLAGSSWLTLTIIGVVVFFAGLSLVPTMVRLQYRIRNAKKEEVSRLRAEIVPLRNEALYGKDVNPGRLADLLSYLLHIESLPELPFDKSKLAVASLYFAVPLGSWIWISVIQKVLGVVG